MLSDYKIPANKFDQVNEIEKHCSKISVAMGLYLLLVIYPAYELLAAYYQANNPAFDTRSLFTASIAAALYVPFAYKIMKSYLASKTRAS